MPRVPVILVHGGAGAWPEHELSAAQNACRTAARQAWEVLQEKATAVEAVQTAVVALENNPLFNAGTGSVLNCRGEIEMDAAIMDGQTLRAGAVCGVRRYANPILIARKIMDSSQSLLLFGDGAENFAREQGLPACDPETLLVDKRRKQWQHRHGTVGAVACDHEGRLAAATSTGGLFDKPVGRVSDSALIGCGTYANRQVAVSCTGIGEAIIRLVLAKHAAEQIAHGSLAADAAEHTIAELVEHTQSEAGIILIDHLGAIGIAFHAAAMPHYWVNDDGEGKIQ